MQHLQTVVLILTVFGTKSPVSATNGFLRGGVEHAGSTFQHRTMQSSDPEAFLGSGSNSNEAPTVSSSPSQPSCNGPTPVPNDCETGLYTTEGCVLNTAADVANACNQSSPCFAGRDCTLPVYLTQSGTLYCLTPGCV